MAFTTQRSVLLGTSPGFAASVSSPILVRHSQRVRNTPNEGYALNAAKVGTYGVRYLAFPEPVIRDSIRGISLLNPGGLTSFGDNRVLSFNGAQQGRATIELPSTVGLIVAARVRTFGAPAATPGAAFGVFAGTGTQSGFGVGYNTSGLGVGFACLTNNGAYSYAVSAVPIGTWATVFVQLAFGNSNSQQVAYINGKPAEFSQGSTTNGPAGAGLDQVVFGSQYRSAGFLRQFNGEIEWASILHVPFDGTAGISLTDDLAVELYEENYPYNLLMPTPRSVWGAA